MLPPERQSHKAILHCPACRWRFRVRADEIAGQDCPRCGYSPADDLDAIDAGEIDELIEEPEEVRDDD